MTTLTLNIADQSVMPMLLNAIKGFKGVTIAPKRTRKARAVESSAVEDTPKIDGEKWAREVLIPIVQEVREATARGYRYPDAHDLLRELEELEAQEA